MQDVRYSIKWVRKGLESQWKRLCGDPKFLRVTILWWRVIRMCLGVGYIKLKRWVMKARNSSENSLTTSWEPKMDELSEEKPMVSGAYILEGVKVQCRWDPIVQLEMASEIQAKKSGDITLPEPNIEPENGCLEGSFPFRKASWQVPCLFCGVYILLRYICFGSKLKGKNFQLGLERPNAPKR